MACPSGCSCVGSVVDCSGMRLTAVPRDLPQHTTELLVLFLSHRNLNINCSPPTLFVAGCWRTMKSHVSTPTACSAGCRTCARSTSPATASPTSSPTPSRAVLNSQSCQFNFSNFSLEFNKFQQLQALVRKQTGCSQQEDVPWSELGAVIGARL